MSSIDSGVPLIVESRSRGGDGAVVAVSGEVDSSNCAELRDEALALFLRGHGSRVSFDLAGLTFMSSAGVRALLECREIAAGQGIDVEVSRAHENVRQVLDICGLTDLFHLPERPAAG